MTSTPGAAWSSKICFNSDCKDLKPEIPRKAWRLRTGEFAELCDRCASAFEEGRFCDTFHLNASGWRSCVSCGKRVHCGCIVSVHAFTLLDAGGIECIACARKNVVLGSSSSLSQSLLFHSSVPEKYKEYSAKGWTQLAGSGPVPWRQAPSLFNSSVAQPELHSRVPYEVDFPRGIDRLKVCDRLSTPSLEKKNVEDFSERLMNGNLKPGTLDIQEKGNSGINFEEQRNSCLTKFQQSSLKEESSNPSFGLAVSYTSQDEANGQIGVSGTQLRPNPQPPPAKQFHSALQNGIDSSSETQIRNGRPLPDVRGKTNLFPRYWPRFTDQDLQQITGDSNSTITPLFEKMLSASDAGRIGRLVLPKKCAEAHFPPISQPEGLPLKVQDSKGKEWIFQFRFWPNNNSRMYVLEGVTPCIQNMQVQAGDIVTFSRLEPGGKLVMGFRKASTASTSDQDNEAKNSNGVSMHGDAEMADPTSWSKVDKSGYIAKEALGAKVAVFRKRKNSSMLGSKSKRLRFDNEDLLELKLTWEEAQGLLRPPPNHVASVVVIEGFEFEEYEDAPILGKPTIFAIDNMGEKIQWAQCEDCFKWRRLPSNVLLPSKWTCSCNSWDPERSSCSATQELTAEQLENLLSQCNPAASKKMKAAKQEPESVDALEGLDTLANLAILGEGDSLPASSQATTKHPRHRPGCTCIVCIQPPSGKGPKHKQTCTCNVCETVKRRFRTLMQRREKKQSQKEAESTGMKQQTLLPDKVVGGDPPSCTNDAENSIPKPKKVATEGSEDDPNRVKSSSSPFKGQIDLNIQPEREEELSPGSDSGSMMKLLQDATDINLRQQSMLTSAGNSNLEVIQTQPGWRPGVEKISSSLNLDVDGEPSAVLSIKTSAPTSATG
ncbi:B3 domain-containing protein Os07g0563300-like isoform X2 [Hibiscus syriacus]|uniref:B3 domain-containing protein Os07g0563300-like isoform X2 n=1 Tax=Hibiscus syriacus TaxID=106335 RepID=UPI00192176FB|nr:B3 domain-containing protein Os07g0563300-like isoform X2 [Hibiscus syriacus]